MEEDPLPGLQQDVFLGVEEAEPQPGPSRGPGLNPSEWGELLGIYQGDTLGEEPIVLHCFESLEDSDAEGNSS